MSSTLYQHCISWQTIQGLHKYWSGFILKRFVFMSWLILLYVVQSIKRLMIVWFLSSLLASDGSVPDHISISSAPKSYYKSAINGKFLVKIHMYTMFSVYAVSNYAVLHLCGTRKWSKFLLYAAIFSHYAVFGQNHSI